MRVIVAEDSALMREGLVRLLGDAGHEVLDGIGDGDALLVAVGEHRPDLVLVDVRMPPTHTDEGRRAALTIRREHPGTAVLVLSQYVERRLARELLDDDEGGVGYLLKDRVADVGDFLDAIARVAAGGTALDPEVVRRLLARTAPDPLATLTARERDVLAAMAEGFTNAAIAAHLHVSASAVEKHVNAVFDKLLLAPGEGYNRRVLAILRHLDP
ncbi:response regulator transcription factor [Actinomycetospora aeridis]|uniref:Response regulator transcription factor n=1 Tax=Actinomycetospora aeridis TaxID=3129231 RepID=A0ABU8N3N6_9PSEU